MITVFKSINETRAPFYREPEEMLQRIKDGRNRAQVEAIRKARTKDERNRLKMALPSICWSGKFPQRNDASIMEHSGLICLDFDALAPKAAGVLRTKLIADPHTFALFTSPGGDGLKVLVKIPPVPEDHKAHFDALGEHYAEKSFDPTSSNLSRVCYTSWDADLYHNPDSLLWEKKKERDFHDMAERPPEIRLRSENEIIRRLLKWWTGKYGLVQGERNANTFKLAAALNDFGVSIIEARVVLMELAHEGFGEREIERTLKSAYSKKEAHGTKYFEDRATRDHIQRALIQGETKADIKRTLMDRMPEAEAEWAINTVERSSPWVEFWAKSDKGVVRIVNHKYKAWLEHNGFRKLYPEGSENFVFVKVEDNLISNTGTGEIKDFTLRYLHNKVADIAIFEHMAGATKYFKEDYLSMLEPIEATFVEDGPEFAMLYFRNCAVRVTRDRVEMIDYLDLEGYVWRKHIVERVWGGEAKDEPGGGDFGRFIHLIAGKDAEREASLRSTVGYLLHSHKTSAKNRAVILNDAEISENPNGGSGKGIFCQAIGKMKRVCVIDGKVFSFDKSFPYQTVGADTQVLAFDDVDKFFRFERLFSLITEGITLEKKNKDAVRLPVQRSPKIIITTNYTVGGVGGSFERRKWEVELAAHFNAKHTPLEEFGRMLFDDWDATEWSVFVRYMVGCVRDYLARGLVASTFQNLHVRKLIKETSHEFWEWASEGNLRPGQRWIRTERFSEFIKEYPDYEPRAKPHGISQKRFTRWMSVWAQHQGLEVSEGKDQAGNRWTLYEDTKVAGNGAAVVIETVEDGLPF
jgi:hypothetical protein